MVRKLTQEYLKECLTYDPSTGIFTWKERPLSHFKNYKGRNITNARYSSKEAGSVPSSSEYREIGINKVVYLAHRLAFLYMEGYFPENDVDHIDRNKDNNKWSNLREASRQCNNQNCGISKNNTSGVTGVSWESQSKKWVAVIVISRKSIHLGRFDNFEDAVMARYHEELTNPNWSCSVESPAYKYLMDNNLLGIFESKDFTKNNLKAGNKSGVTGVHWDKSRNKWSAKMMKERKDINLGYFEKFEEAVMERYKEEVKNYSSAKMSESSSYKYLKEKGLI